MLVSTHRPPLSKRVAPPTLIYDRAAFLRFVTGFGRVGRRFAAEELERTKLFGQREVVPNDCKGSSEPFSRERFCSGQSSRARFSTSQSA